MSSFWKWLAVIVGTIGLGVVLLVGAGVVWVVGVVSDTKFEIEDGEAYGAEHDWFGCETMALNKVEDCGEGVRCIMGAAVFHASCLGTADKTETFCSDVPHPESTEVEAWAAESCVQVEMENHKGCMAIMGASSALCHGGTYDVSG